MSRQNYYARRRQRRRRQVEGDLVEQMVRQERAVQSRVGVRKLHRMLQESLKQAGVTLGRDRMFAELRGRGLLVQPLPGLGPVFRFTQGSRPGLTSGSRLPALAVWLTGANSLKDSNRRTLHAG